VARQQVYKFFYTNLVFNAPPLGVTPWEFSILKSGGCNSENWFQLRYRAAYRVAQKVSHKLFSTSSPNIDRFSKFFHWLILWKCVIKWLIYIYHHTLTASLYYHLITHFPQNVSVNKFWKSVNIWRRCGQKFVAYFLGHPVERLLVREL